MTDTNSSEVVEDVTFSPAHRVGDQVLVNSVLGFITSWPDVEDSDAWFTYEIRHINGSTDRHTEQLGVVHIDAVPELGE